MQTTLARSFAVLLTAATLATSPVAAQTLYSQADLTTNPGVGFNGANVSAVSPSGGFFGFTATNGVSVADDFSITGNPWSITGFRFFAYQTNSPRDLSSPFTTLGWQLWNGRPGDMGSSVIAGNLATNSLTYTGFSGIYRTLGSDLQSTVRPIMVLDASANLTLNAGTYWLQWTLGNVQSAFVPPLPADQMVAANAVQSSGNSWSTINDGGNPVELPFEVFGAVECDMNVVPEPSTYALMATGLVGLVGVSRRRRSTAA